jgi:hypothetical protein
MPELSFNELAIGLAFGGAAAIAVGSFLVMDDVSDFGEIISTWGKEPGRHGVLRGMTMPDLPPHMHHWLFGVILLILGAFLLALGLALLIKTFISSPQEA